MIKNLTIKDMLYLYSPCYSCKKDVDIVWAVFSNPAYSQIKPSLNNRSLSLDLKITYYNRFQLMIDIMSHSILSTDASQLADYVANNKCYLKLECRTCKSGLLTNQINFDLHNRIIKPISIMKESWHLYDDDNYYHVETNLNRDESNISISPVKSANTKSFNITTVPIPIKKYSSREDFIETLNQIVLFS